MQVHKFIKNRIIIKKNASQRQRIFSESEILHITTHLYNCERFFVDENLVRYVKVFMHRIAVERKIELLKIGCDFTHCHFVIRLNLGQDVTTVVNGLKGGVSRAVRKKFEYLNFYPCFWAKGYYLKIYKENINMNLLAYVQNQTRELNNKLNQDLSHPFTGG